MDGDRWTHDAVPGRKHDFNGKAPLQISAPLSQRIGGSEVAVAGEHQRVNALAHEVIDVSLVEG